MKKLLQKTQKNNTLAYFFTIFMLLFNSAAAIASNEISILNVSYDATRELYQEYNLVFAKYWEAKTGQKVTIKQSHGGSGKQARAVIDGLDADVVTLALAHDIDAIAKKAHLISENWQSRLLHNSSPYTSTIIFLVRTGNPKKIKDWNDLVRPDISVITPNPKTSGSACWNYLAAWGYALLQSNSDVAQAKDFITKLYKNVAVLDSGARGATTTFVERGIGDVLINWENEIFLSGKELGNDKFDIIIPSISILAEPTVSIVDKVVEKHDTKQLAQAYLEYLYSDEAQEIAAKHYFRPTNQNIVAKYHNQFPKIKLFTLQEIVGNWDIAYQIHFIEGGIFDQIYQPKK